MSITNHWRNKQLGSTSEFLRQELVCLDFLNKNSDLTWAWSGSTGNFYNYCKDHFQFDSVSPTGLVIINFPVRQTPKQFVRIVDSLISSDICAVYLAVNRYEFVAENDLKISYQHDLEDSIDQIVNYIKVPMCPTNFNCSKVDGQHFVGVHGLDIYTYENCQRL
jgi:hypothetical protein